jgi:adenylate cyclase
MRSMVKTAQFYNGRVRNIIGDRVMVLFDEENCFTNAIQTAILLNSVAQHILNKHFSHNEIKCGIGIDYGRILVSKGGIKKNGTENAPYKSLVWLGRPANVASKLTDLANKTTEITTTEKVHYFERSAPPYGQNNKIISMNEFLGKDLFENAGWKKFTTTAFPPSFYCTSPEMIYYYPRVRNETKTKSITTKPILMTKDVYDGYVKANPESTTVKNNYLTEQDKDLYPGYTIYEGDMYYPDIKND